MTGVPELIAKAYGTVLELGPGSGTQLPRYNLSKIDRIYGVEPNVDLHDALRANVKKHGLSDIYTIVPCVIEDFKKLREYGIETETVDTVTSMQVLCSVPKPEALAKDLYKLLKPGGQMIVYEHVKSEDYVSRFVQCLYSLLSLFISGLTFVQWLIMWSGRSLWVIVTWIAIRRGTCSRLAVGLRASWLRRKRRMLGCCFRVCLGGWSSGVWVRNEGCEWL